MAFLGVLSVAARAIVVTLLVVAVVVRSLCEAVALLIVSGALFAAGKAAHGFNRFRALMLRSIGA